MPSVLFFTNDFGPRIGGIENGLVGFLERMPFGEVVVYTCNQGDTRDYDRAWLEKFGVEIIRDRAEVLLPTPRIIQSAIAVMKEQSIKKVWLGALAPLGVASRWFRKAGAEVVVGMSHGHEYWWSKIPPFTFAMREIGKQIDHTTYLGSFTYRTMSRWIAPEKLVHNSPGIDYERFVPGDSKELRAKYGIDQKPSIVSVGRLVHRKGQDRLIESLPIIHRQVPDTQLVFIGDGPYEKNLKKIVQRMELQDHVRFLGRISDDELASHMLLGDIFAMPARDRLFGLEVEGLGLVYLEASACEIPVIVGNSGGAPDTVIDGETGFVVDGNDIHDIAARICELLQDEQRRIDMGRRGRQWVIDHWNWQRRSALFNKELGFSAT